MARPPWPLALAVLAVCGCDDESTAGGGGGQPPVGDCPPPNRVIDDGSCVAPGVQDSGCLAGELTLDDGSCLPAGVPAEVVSDGFTPVDGGFEAILPAAPCPSGMMAVPGDATCRPVMDCGSGRWGNLPVDSATIYVDQSHGGASTGSEAEPFTTIGEAIAAAPPGGLVAVAAGNYAEELVIQNNPVRLWGVCPEQVEVFGGALLQGVIAIVGGASGSEVGGLALRGPDHGFLISGATDLVIDRVWIHDTGSRGLEVDGYYGETSVTLRASLVEHVGGVAAFLWGAALTIEDSMVRDTSTSPTEDTGHAVMARLGPNGEPTQLTVRGSYLTDNLSIGIWVLGAQAIIEDSVVGGPTPQADRGIAIEADPATGTRGDLTIRGTLIQNTRSVALFGQAADVEVDYSVVRGTVSRSADGRFGRGVSFEDDPLNGERASAVMRSCLVEGNQEHGVMVGGADGTLAGLIVRDTLPQDSGQALGRGVATETSVVTGQRGNLTVRGSVIERNHEVGLFVTGSDGFIYGTIVRHTLPNGENPASGTGIAVQEHAPAGASASLTLHGSLIHDNFRVGLIAMAATVTTTGTVIRDTRVVPDTGLYGDGVSLIDSNAGLSFSLIEANARAGCALWGSIAALEGVGIECNVIDMTIDDNAATTTAFDDAGGNVCGCAGNVVECKALTSSLSPPGPLDPAQ
jgi:hypothetical protein